MSKRPMLKPDRWEALLAAAADETALIGYCTLEPEDLDLVRAKTVPHNQLGLALQICLLKHRNRQWRHDEALPEAMVTFVAEQIDVSPDVLAEQSKQARGGLAGVEMPLVAARAGTGELPSHQPAEHRHRRIGQPLSSVLQFSVKVGFENSLIGLPCGSFRRG